MPLQSLMEEHASKYRQSSTITPKLKHTIVPNSAFLSLDSFRAFMTARTLWCTLFLVVPFFSVGWKNLDWMFVSPNRPPALYLV